MIAGSRADVTAAAQDGLRSPSPTATAPAAAYSRSPRRVTVIDGVTASDTPSILLPSAPAALEVGGTLALLANRLSGRPAVRRNRHHRARPAVSLIGHRGSAGERRNDRRQGRQERLGPGSATDARGRRCPRPRSCPKP